MDNRAPKRNLAHRRARYRSVHRRSGALQATGTPNGTIERTKLQAWLNFFSSEMHKGAFGPLFYKGISEESKVVFRRRLRARFAHLDQHLADHEYLIGNEFTIADAHFFAVTNWAPRVDFDLSQYPKVLAHHARIAARPTVRAAMEAEGPIPGAGS